MSLITPDFGLLFWMTLIFAIVFFLLAKFGFPIITRMVDSRSQRIADSLQKAKEAEQQLAEMTRTQEQMLQDTRKEQNRILKEAADARDAMIAQAKQQAQDEAARIVEHAKVQIAAERETALRDIRAQVADLSVSVAEKLMRTDLSKDGAQAALADKLTREMTGLQTPKQN